MRIVLSFLLVLLIAGCASTEPAQVSDTRISNPSVGYNGYESKIPEGFTVVDENDEFSLAVGRMIKQAGGADTYSRGFGGSYLRDKIILNNRAKGVVVVFVVKEINLPLPLSQYPQGQFNLIAAQLEKKKPEKIEGTFLRHFGTKPRFILEFIGQGVEDDGETVYTTELTITGQLNELIYIFAMTNKVESKSYLSEVVWQMQQGTTIF